VAPQVRGLRPSELNCGDLLDSRARMVVPRITGPGTSSFSRRAPPVALSLTGSETKTYRAARYTVAGQPWQRTAIQKRCIIIFLLNKLYKSYTSILLT
jgi:hypothetical protein